MGQQGELIGH